MIRIFSHILYYKYLYKNKYSIEFLRKSYFNKSFIDYLFINLSLYIFTNIFEELLHHSIEIDVDVKKRNKNRLLWFISN